jgi:hypothetical protein
MNNGLNNQTQQRVLQGNRTLQGNTQGQSQQQAQQINPMQMLAQVAGRFAGSMNTPQNSMHSLYNYGAAGTNWASLIGMDADVTDEQQKAAALAEGGTVAYQTVQLCVHRRASSPMYVAWRNALERFKSPLKGGARDPIMEGFVNDIDSRQALHNFILAQAGIQLGAVIAINLMAGDTTIRQQPAIVQEVFYKCCIDIITLQFLDYLGNGKQLYYRLTPLAKKELAQREEPIYYQVLDRFTFSGLECPYSKGKLASIAEDSTLHNPLLEVSNPGDMGMSGNIFDVSQHVYVGQQQTDNNDFLAWINNKARAVDHVRQTEGYTPVQHNTMEIPSYDNFDQPKLNLEDINWENRLKYNLNDYAVEVPGTGWYILHRYHLSLMQKALRLEDGTPFSMRDTNVLGKLAVYRFDWQRGIFGYRFINYEVADANEMSKLLSNPSELLPFMYEEDGVQKTTFDLKDMETKEFIRDGYIVPMEEMKKLDKKPDLLVASSPMKANLGNENTLMRINAHTKAHDPKSQLDAFVVPMTNTRQWTLDEATNMDAFYSKFKLMVHGNTEEKTDTAHVIRQLRGVCREHSDKEFTTFVASYLTNLVNRWLVEERGYAEDKKDTSGEYLRVGNIFDDLDELIEWLNSNDQPTLRAFMMYGSNDFMRDGIEILMPKDETQKEFETLYQNEDETSRAVMLNDAKRKIIFKRNSAFINLIKDNGPHSLDAVYIKESINPRLFAIVRKAIEIGSRHFKERPQVLVKFHKDEGNKVWALTRSGFDPEGVYVLRAVSSFEDFVHPVPVCE